MLQPQRILVIGGSKKIFEKAKALGLEVLSIQKKEAFQEAQLELAEQTFLFDYENVDLLVPMAKTIYELFPFGYAVTFAEWGLEPTAHVIDALGLPGNSAETVRLLRDKGIMRERLNAAGFSPVAARRGSGVEDLLAFVQEHGYPVIVKPVDGAGSMGVFKIHNAAEVHGVWEAFGALGNREFMVEEFLEGPEISVETFSFDGRHRVITMTDKVIESHFVEIGHSMPAQLSAEWYAEVEKLVIEFLDLIDFKVGPAHTEVKLTAKGPRIVESHNRPGGDKLTEMVEIAYGIDTVQMAMCWPFGLVEEIREPLPLRAGVAIRFMTPEPGIVERIEGVDEVKADPAVEDFLLAVQQGGEVRPVKFSLDRAGHVLVKAATVQESIAKSEQLVERVRFITRPVGEAVEAK